MGNLIKENIRILAAIMFTDIVGYTSLMQDDEARAKKIRDEHRKTLERLTLNHQGQILQYYGDGTLTIFASAIEGVQCAVEIQKEMQKDPAIPLRIGLHLGDVVYENEGVYGDGVNVASRIQSLGVPGSVLVSDKVFDELANHPDLKPVSLGRYELKNVKRPVQIFALANEGLVVPCQLGDSEKKIRPGIAVLPFVNMSADPENEYFSDGITEEILNALAKVETIKVPSRTSSFAFKNKNEDIREIAQQLDVNYVLEGSVRRAGNRVRVTGQLINARDGYHIWSETFDRDLEDIFEVQDEISRKIANKLHAKLFDKKFEEPLVIKRTSNIEAYNIYLKGQYLWNKFTPGAALKAIDLFEQVIEAAPDFSQAYSSIASCYVFLAAIGHLPSIEAYPKARTYIDKALSLSNDLPETFCALAMVRLFFDWDFDGARRALDEAFRLNPGLADVHKCYVLYYWAVNDPVKAIDHAEKTVELDPLSLQHNSLLADSYFNGGRDDEAFSQIKKTLEIDPGYRPALNSLGWFHVFSGNLNEGKKIFYDLQKSTGSDLKVVAPIGYIEAKLGNSAKALECIEKLKERKEKYPQMQLWFDYAMIYLGLENYDKVFEYFNKCFDDKIGGIIFLSKRPWNDLRSDERFTLLMKKIGLPLN